MIRIYGCSDDLVEIEGNGISEETDAGTTVYFGERSSCLAVTLDFETHGWEFKVFQPYIDDDDGEVPWPVHIQQCRQGRHAQGSYSLELVVDCPEGTPVSVGSEPVDQRRKQALAKLDDDDRAALGL